MKRKTLDLLCCPDCETPLRLRDDCGDGNVSEGALCCSSCGTVFPIERGIPQFISPDGLRGTDRTFARFYDMWSRFEILAYKFASLMAGGERKMRGAVLDRLDPSAERVLEVSVGSGGNLRYLFERPALTHVCGLDISGGQLAHCSNAVDKNGWPVDLFLASAERMPFRSDTFDSVFHVGGINFFSEKQRAIEEMIRVARPGSKIVIADESERVARSVAFFAGLSRAQRSGELDLSVPVHLVPDTMQGIRVEGIWRAHGEYHGYCLEFTKPT